MLHERYPNAKLFDEIIQLDPKMDPVSAKIDQYLENELFFLKNKTDLTRRINEQITQ